MKRLRVFVASPSDVSEERDLVTTVVDELRRILRGVRDVELETVRWETHAWPDVDEDAQAVINRTVGEFDIFVGVMWRRFGTPTRRAASGTGEEFELAYNAFKSSGKPKIMFYFRVQPFYTTDVGELEQFAKVVNFRKKLDEDGVLFWQYSTPLEFERFVREHLIRQILTISGNRHPRHGAARAARESTVAPRPVRIFMSAAREDVERVLPVYHALKAAGFEPWLDVENLLPGQRWEVAITQAIKESDVVLAFISKHTVSRKGFVNRELRIAMDVRDTMPESTVFVIPARLDDVEPPEPLRILQWVDLFAPGGLEFLLQALRAVSNKSPQNITRHKPRSPK